MLRSLVDSEMCIRDSSCPIMERPSQSNPRYLHANTKHDRPVYRGTLHPVPIAPTPVRYVHQDFMISQEPPPRAVTHVTQAYENLATWQAASQNTPTAGPHGAPITPAEAVNRPSTVTHVTQAYENLATWQATPEEMTHVIPTTTTTISQGGAHSQTTLGPVSRSQQVRTNHTHDLIRDMDGIAHDETCLLYTSPSPRDS